MRLAIESVVFGIRLPSCEVTVCRETTKVICILALLARTIT